MVSLLLRFIFIENSPLVVRVLLKDLDLITNYQVDGEKQIAEFKYKTSH